MSYHSTQKIGPLDLRALLVLPAFKRAIARFFMRAIARGKTSFLLALALIAGLMVSAPRGAHAQGLIRDAETENLIRLYAQPLLRASGLSTQGIHIHLIGRKSFNAFVIDGQNMIIHVGTLFRSKTPNQVIGVIAHELGHIEGGHLARLRDQIANAQSTSLMIQILGIAAMAAGAFAGGNNSGDLGKAGAAVLSGGQAANQRAFLAYRRVEESSADLAALRYLNATKQSALGMLQTFEYFADQGLASLKYVDPYVQSHPMPQQRIVQLRVRAQESPYFRKRDSAALQYRHDLMRAKLTGFLDNPQTVFNRYPVSNNSIPANYARAIARYRQGDLQGALNTLDEIIAKKPNYPYFHELKGQFLYEKGQARRAIKPLRRALKIAPHEALIRILLAQALLANGGARNVDEAIVHLRKAIVKENKSPDGYRYLAQAYGTKGKIADAQLATAYRYFLEGKIGLAKQQAKRAKKHFRRGSPSWLKADDILNYHGPQKN